MANCGPFKKAPSKLNGFGQPTRGCLQLEACSLDGQDSFFLFSISQTENAECGIVHLLKGHPALPQARRAR
jgi:hypothetical protein